MGIQPGQLVLACSLILMGILTYYVAPVSFLYNDLKTFGLVLNIVVMMMILGLSFAAQLLLRSFENVSLKLLLETCF